MSEAEPTVPLQRPRTQPYHVAALVAGAGVLFAAPVVAALVLLAASDRPAAATWFAGTLVGAALLMQLFWSAYRVIGFVPCAAVAWLAAVGHGAYWHEWPGWAHGVPLGLLLGAMIRARVWTAPRGGPVVLAVALATGASAAWAIYERGQPLDAGEWLLLAAAVALAGWSWARLFRPLFELSLEPVVRPMYRVRATGPGLSGFPRTGPCLILANHACWLDPIFLADAFPRPVTPMMTARFYDLPILRQLMAAFRVIRVPEKALKKDAPEVQEAIAALDRGECVVIFPEGYLRRTEDKPLRRFGQGVWQILKARPGTPVFAAWIEGAWGSYTSYYNGRPTKNKPKDFRRPIGVGVSSAITIPPEELDEHLRTRIYLMNLVSAARRHLGLDPLPPFELHAKADEPEEEGETEAPAV